MNGIEMSADDLVRQKQQLQQVRDKLFTADEHYAKIGQSNKDVLLQPGAQILATAFGYAATYQIEPRDLGHGHREYAVVCRLIHRESGKPVGEGVGVCSTMEAKYRWRQRECGTVPQAYWAGRDPALLGGAGRKTRKRDDGSWAIVERAEEENPAEHYNTCSKMAAKRAFVAATITATGSSDIFTQDLEDYETDAVPERAGAPRAATRPASSVGQGAPSAPPPRAEPPQTQSAEPPVDVTNKGAGRYKIASVETFSGTKNNKPWTRYEILTENGVKFKTLEHAVGEVAQDAHAAGVEVEIEYEKITRGKWCDIMARNILVIADEPPQPEPPPAEPDNQIADAIIDLENWPKDQTAADVEVVAFGDWVEAKVGGRVRMVVTAANGRFGVCDEGLAQLLQAALDSGCKSFVFYWQPKGQGKEVIHFAECPF